MKDENLRLRDHDPEELSHYSNATTDIEYMFPFGWGELWGIADRTDFDLTQHQNTSRRGYTSIRKQTRSIFRMSSSPRLVLTVLHWPSCATLMTRKL